MSERLVGQGWRIGRDRGRRPRRAGHPMARVAPIARRRRRAGEI